MDSNDLQSPFVEIQGSPRISVRTYNLIMAGLILVGFTVMGAGALWARTLSFQLMLAGNFLLLGLGPLIASIAGIIMMSVAAGRQSTPLSLAGFSLFVAGFGITAGVGLSAYDLPAVNTAFFATAGITAVAGIAGLMFPGFFQRIGGVLFSVLVGVFLVEVVLMFMGVGQTVTDWIMVAVFSGFIAYDFNRAARLEPTVPNAVLSASNLFVDIVNVLLRLLRIFSRDN